MDRSWHDSMFSGTGLSGISLFLFSPSSERFYRPSIGLFRVIGNYTFGCITELLRCYRCSESRLFGGQRQLLFLLGRARLLSHPLGEKLGSRHASSSSKFHILGLLIFFAACNLLPNSFRYAAVYKLRVFFCNKNYTYTVYLAFHNVTLYRTVCT